MPEDFCNRLDLAVRLVDAVDGRAIGEKQATFLRNGKQFMPRLSANGHWLLVNTGREDFLLGVHVRGFEEIWIPVRYKTLSQRLPEIEILLVPKQSAWNVPPLVSLEGKMEGMEELQAVEKREEDLYAVSYDEKDGTLSLYNPHRKKLTQSYYALSCRDWREFEIIRILKQLPKDMVQTDYVPKKAWKGSCSLVHLVHGMVSANGRYLLRLPDNGTDSEWLVRCVVRGEEYFQTINIRHPVLTCFTEGQIEKKG